MRGDLSETTVADLCRGLSAAGATGAVEVEDHAGDARIFFRSGDVYWAVSPTPRARLGDRLVNAGILTQEQLDEALDEQRSSPQRTKLGALLVERGLVSRDAIRVFVQEQILDAIFEMVQWHEGHYVFNPGEVADEKLPIDIPVDQVLVEVSRRQSEWAQIAEVIPDLDMVPDFVTGGSSANAALEPDEFAVLANVDGARSIRDLADALGYSEFEAARIVYGLTLLGIVQVDRAEEDDTDDEPGDRDGIPDDEIDVASALEEAVGGHDPGPASVPPIDRPRPSVKLHVDPEVRDYLPPHGPPPESVAEPEPQAEPEPEAEPERATEPEPEPVPAAELEPEPEPEFEPEPEPDAEQPLDVIGREPEGRSVEDLTAALTSALDGPAEDPADAFRDLFDDVPAEPRITEPSRPVVDEPAERVDDVAYDDEPEPWVASADDDTATAPDVGFFPAATTSATGEAALDDEDFDALLNELGAPDDGEPPRGDDPEPAPARTSTPSPRSAPARPSDPEPVEPRPAAEEEPPARRSGGGGDVSEFLRELSQLAIDEPPASANPGPTRKPAEQPAATDGRDAGEAAAASREEERRQAAEKRDERNKKRGLFGWGR